MYFFTSLLTFGWHSLISAFPNPPSLGSRLKSSWCNGFHFLKSTLDPRLARRKDICCTWDQSQVCIKLHTADTAFFLYLRNSSLSRHALVITSIVWSKAADRVRFAHRGAFRRSFIGFFGFFSGAGLSLGVLQWPLLLSACSYTNPWLCRIQDTMFLCSLLYWRCALLSETMCVERKRWRGTATILSFAAVVSRNDKVT